MQLIGYMDSPYVRRVAVSARFLDIEFEHREISIFREYEHFLSINPLVKVPTLICDDGEVLVDSSLIIDWFETLAGRSLMPRDAEARLRALKMIGTALVAMEKAVSLIIELGQRPAEKVHEPWIERITTQLDNAIALLDRSVGDGSEWFGGSVPNQADITTAITWSFVQNKMPERAPPAQYPGLAAFSERAEALAEFIACPIPAA